MVALGIAVVAATTTAATTAITTTTTTTVVAIVVVVVVVVVVVSGNWICRTYYFLMLLLQFPSMFPLLTYSQLFLSLTCRSPKTLKTKEKQDFNSTDTGNSLKSNFTT